MLKHRIAIISIIVGILFLLGCSKNNHDVLAVLGDESYLKSLDDIYPGKYRKEWPVIAPSYYHFEDGFVSPQPDEGPFPPDMNGEYKVNFKYINGTFAVVFNGSFINIPGSDCVMSIKISNQKNSIADFDFKLNEKSYPVENVYIYGKTDEDDATKGIFTLCFEYSEKYGNIGGESMKNFYGCVVTGTISDGKVSDANCWVVIRRRQPAAEMNYSYILGGQQFFKSVF